jgi:peptidyl-prolyl cis-trans isomerase D
MLQKIREKITGWVAWTIIITIAVVFAVWGIDLSFTPRAVAAKVNGEEVPLEPVRRAYQEQISRLHEAFRGDVPAEIAGEVRRGVIEQHVRRELLRQRIQQERYRVSDEELLAYIQSYEVFHVGGRFSMDAYRAALSGAGYTPTAFEADQRRSLAIQQLQEGIVISSFITRDEIERRVALERELREVDWLKLPLERLLAEVEVTEVEIEEYYQATSEQWMLPESVDLAYIELRLDRLAEEIEVSEDDLRAFYESEMRREPERYVGRERRRAAHILVRAGDEAEERVSALRERIEAGEEFADVAREASEDPGSARAGGELGWIERGMMVPAFEEALFAMEEGTLSAPVRSEFGWHLIKLQDIERSEGATFAEAREELKRDYSLRLAEDRYYDQAEMLARIAFERPDSLEPAAAELGHEIRTVEGVTRRGGPEIGANPSVIDAAWSEAVFERRENSALIELDDGHAAVIRVVDYNPPELQPLDQVTEEIADELRRNRAAVQARELGREARERLEAGETIDEIAEALAGDYVAGLTIVRNDVSVPPDVSRAAFAAPRPAADAPTVVGTESATGYFVIKVRSVTPGGLDLLRPDERQELIDAIRNGRASRELQAYLEDLRQNARVTIFERSLE